MQIVRDKKCNLLLCSVKSSYCENVKLLSNYLSILEDISVNADKYKTQYLYTENNLLTML